MTDSVIAANVDEAVGGFVRPGFEGVRAAFAQSNVGTGGAAFSAYVEGRLVADLWKGESAAGRSWTEGTVSNLFSTTKFLTAVCALLLVDRGLLDLDAPVSKYWPEFAQAGKEGALVRHILGHTVGLVGLDDAASLLSLDGSGWDNYEALATRLAEAAPAWEPGTRHGYHAITFGWLMGELIRRVDGRGVGQFFREEVADPFELDLWIGTPLDIQESRAATLIEISTDGFPEVVRESIAAVHALMADPTGLVGQQCIALEGTSVIAEVAPFFGSPAGRTPEIAAVNGVGSARSLAKLLAVLSAGGELSGIRLASRESIACFSEVNAEGLGAVGEGVTLPDGSPYPRDPERWGLGFIRNLPAATGLNFGPNDETFGHAGLGGQVGFADPVQRVSVGFVRNHLALEFSASDGPIAALYASLSTGVGTA